MKYTAWTELHWLVQRVGFKISAEQARVGTRNVTQAPRGRMIGHSSSITPCMRNAACFVGTLH